MSMKPKKDDLIALVIQEILESDPYAINVVMLLSDSGFQWITKQFHVFGTKSDSVPWSLQKFELGGKLSKHLLGSTSKENCSWDTGSEN